MGVCELKKNKSGNIPQIKIDKKLIIKNSQNKINNEAIIPGNASYINIELLKNIIEQKGKSICKIIKKEIPIGTGFLCNIIGHSITTKALITAYHVLGEDDLKLGNIVKITFDNNNENIKIIKINNQRFIYASEKDDITIIEIIDDDNLKKFNYLEIDKNIYNNNSDFNKEYNNKSICILHYPKGILLAYSDNIIIKIDENYMIYHLCSSEHGSSGAPILLLDTLKVIGIHQGNGYFDKNIFNKEEVKKGLILNENNNIYCNFGKIIKESIFNFNIKDNKIILSVKIDDDFDIGKKIYFLQNDNEVDGILKLEDVKNHKLNLNDFIVLVDDKICKTKNYLIPQKKGIYHIQIYINKLINDCFGFFCNCKKIIKIDLSSFDTKNTTNMNYMFYNCRSLENINLSNFITKNVFEMEHMFGHCENLRNIDLSSFDTQNVINLGFMFYFCFSLKNIDLSSFNTENVTGVSYMFWFCNNLKNINLSSLNTKNVTDMRSMFESCCSLNNIDLSSIDTRNVTDMSGMFKFCESLKYIDLSSFDTTSVISMNNMFSWCKNLENINLSSFNTKNVTNMSEMFYYCEKLKILDLFSFETKNVTNMSGMFHFCKNLENINLSNFDTENVTNISEMFSDCEKLETIDLSSFDAKNVNSKYNLFRWCKNLKILKCSDDTILNEYKNGII